MAYKKAQNFRRCRDQVGGGGEEDEEVRSLRPGWAVDFCELPASVTL